MPVRESDIVTIRQSGSGNMGSVTDALSVARASLPSPTYALKSLRVTFTAGTSSATLSLKRDSGYGTIYDTTLRTFLGVGNGGDSVNFRVPDAELADYLFRTDPVTRMKDVAVLEWTDPGTSSWLIEWGLVDGSLIGA